MNRVLPFFSGGGFAFAPTLTGMVADYNLNTAAIAAGWDGIRPLIATVTIAAGAIVYGASTAAGAAAFTVPALPDGSLVTIVRNGSIIGRGGAGGTGGGATIGSAAATVGGTGYDGLKLSWPVRLVGSGMIAGGGGGGGGGQGITIDSPNGQYNSAGGSGGMGASNGGSTTGNTGGSGVRNGDATYHATGGKAGDGGLPGQQGGSGTAATGVGPVNSTRAPAAGGQPGRSIVGAEFVILDGNVLGDVRGAMAFGTNSYIPTPQATPAVGAALDGGYYTGYNLWAMLEAEQGGVSRAVAQGAVNLYMPGMIGNPKVYGGQAVWLKSASDPATMMLGTVTGAANGLLSINVTAGSSGTASDWVLMASHRVVVAPKSGGETTVSIADSALTLPIDVWTLTEGAIAQAAMRAAAGATPSLAPAHAWAAALNLGGKTDWVVPTRDMLEAAYRGLKPATANNYATADRAASPTNTYQRFGAPADTSNRHGYKASDPAATIPANTIYLSGGNPFLTSSLPFRVGGAEAFDWGTGVTYLSATAYDASTVWAQAFDAAQPGRQITVAKTTSSKVRAMRLSAI